MNGQESFNQNAMLPHGTEPHQEAVSYHIPRERTILPDDFEPTSADIICGRGKESHSHIGNKRFRTTIAMNAERYKQANSKVAKSLVVISIVNGIRRLTPHGGFVKRDEETNRWIEIGDQQAKEKVGHALRDYIAGKNKRRKSSIRTSDKNPNPQKQRAKLKSEGDLESADGNEDLCDDFFTDFVVETFLGKRSADGRRRQSLPDTTENSPNEGTAMLLDASFPRKDPPP